MVGICPLLQSELHPCESSSGRCIKALWMLACLHNVDFYTARGEVMPVERTINSGM